MARARRGLPALLLGLAVAIAATFAIASPAGAHAVVVSSSPSQDERLTTSPSEVSIQFSEAVTSDLGGLTVLDQSGQRVDQDDSSQPTPTTLRTSLEPDLPEGTYIANYKVVSADGHPIAGAIVFGVGQGPIGDVTDLAAANDPTLDRIGVVARFLTYAAGLLAAGLAVFLAFLHDGGADRRRPASVVQVATVVAGVGAVLTIAVQAALATGDGLGAMFRADVLQGVLREGLGWETAVLLVGLALCHLAVAGRPSVTTQALAFYGGLAVATSFVFWGHAREAPTPVLAIAADVVHVAVASLWFGGLVGLVLTLRARRRTAREHGLPEPTLLPAAAGRDGHQEVVGAALASSPADAVAADGPARIATAVLDRPTGSGGSDETTGDDDRADPERDASEGAGSDRPAPGSLASTVSIVRRFSTTAACSVVVLAITGTVLAWGELGSLDALTSTGYGRTLLVKLAFVALVLGLAAYNRFLLLPWLLAEPDPPSADAVAADQAEIDAGLEAGWRSLFRTVLAEAALIVVVLAVTAVLVNAVPGRAAGATTGPFVETRPFRDGSVTLTITPNQPGTNSFHVDFVGADGRPADLAQKVVIELRLPAQDLGPIEREMIKASTGHFLLEGVSDLSIAGTWEITLAIRVSDFDLERVTFTDTIT